MQRTDDHGLVFPCRFPIKAMGHDGDDFSGLVTGIVQGHAGDIPPQDIQRRPSRNGKYLSVTVTIEARSREQLDAIYRELSGHPRVLMVL